MMKELQKIYLTDYNLLILQAYGKLRIKPCK